MKTHSLKNEGFCIDLLGYGGGVMSLTAYLLVANDLVAGDSILFLLLNLVAGLFLMIYTHSKKAYANTILNSFWFLISIVGIARIIY